jgi:hypothetical protein
MLLAICVIVAVIYLEARLSKAKVRRNRHVMTTGWAVKLLVLPPTLFSVAILVYTLTDMPDRPIAFLFYLLPGTFALGLILVCIDVFVRRVIYDERGIELTALFARQRRVFLEWNKIRQVNAAFDKIKLTTDTGKFVVYGHLRGCKGFMAYRQTACPQAEIVGSY